MYKNKSLIKPLILNPKTAHQKTPKKTRKKAPSKEQGSVLIMVLLFSSILAVMVLFSWESAILQNKMAHNYTTEVLDRIKAEVSLDQAQARLIKNHFIVGAELIQFVADPLMLNENSGTDYYRIYSDPTLKVKLQATIAVRRAQNGQDTILTEVTRKTWEEIRD